MTHIRTRVSPGRIAAWALLVVALFATVFPFYWMVRTALTPAADLYTDSTGLVPDHPTMINFLRVLGLTSQEEAVAAGAPARRSTSCGTCSTRWSTAG